MIIIIIVFSLLFLEQTRHQGKNTNINQPKHKNSTNLRTRNSRSLKLMKQMHKMPNYWQQYYSIYLGARWKQMSTSLPRGATVCKRLPKWTTASLSKSTARSSAISTDWFEWTDFDPAKSSTKSSLWVANPSPSLIESNFQAASVFILTTMDKTECCLGKKTFWILHLVINKQALQSFQMLHASTEKRRKFSISPAANWCTLHH